MPRSCKKCDRSDTDEMVACDNCGAWFHFDCVGESPGVENREFRCSKCIFKEGKKIKKKSYNESSVPSKAVSSIPIATYSTTSGEILQGITPRQQPDNDNIEKKDQKSARNDTKSIVSTGSRRSEARLQLEFRRMEEELALKEKELAEEKAIKEKRIDIERILTQKKMQQEKELQEKQLLQERALLEKQLSDEIEFQRQQRCLREKFQKERFEMLAADLDLEEGAIGGRNSEGSIVEGSRKVNEWLNEQKQCLPSSRIHDNREIIAKQPKEPTEQDTPRRNPEVSMAKNGNKSHQTNVIEGDNGSSSSNDDYPEDCRSLAGEHPSVSHYESGPNKAQRAARQVLSKKLPVFTGRVEEWPLFYSSFVNSTKACGFSNIENLVRLQECLKGSALESVRSRLLLPQSVPQVIEALRTMYGRPEQLIHMLLNKVKTTDAPKADRLETFIPFGLAIQELCDHLEAADHHDHLVNPVLIQEMVDKLPAATKREWVQYKRNTRRVTLRTFADFASQIAAEASEVTLVIPPKDQSSNRKIKEKGFIHTHHMNTNINQIAPCCICNKDNHRVRNCDDFRDLSIPDRLRLMERFKLCEKCLNAHEGWCGFKITCNVGDCRERHHPLVHRERLSHAQGPSRSHVSGQHHAHVSTNLSILFRIIPVKVHSKHKTISTFAYLDEGSSMTLIEDSLLRQLNTRGIPQPLTLQWTGNVVRREPASERVSLKITGSEGSECFDLRNAHSVKSLQLPKQYINFQNIIDHFSHLKGLRVANHCGEEPKLLIGLDNAFLLAPLESRVRNIDEPIAVRSHLGWTIYGPKYGTFSNDFIGLHDDPTNQQLHDMMQSFFNVEEVGITVQQLPISAADARARTLLESTTIRVNGHYETGLLWKKNDFAFPDSFGMALNRLCSLERRLKKNPTLEQAVRKQIDYYQTMQYAHKATAAELASADPRKVWYLPVNVVINPKKPNKLRLVWDAAAQVEGTSLNSMLLTGPDLLTSLPAIIQKFRERTIAFGADIREMYHQIKIREKDKHSQRFLFRNDPSQKPDIYLMDVATFGSACSPVSAQYVKNINAERYADQFPEAVSAIIRRTYVDDYFDSENSLEKAIEKAKQVRFIHAQAGFEIRNWISNSTKFVQELGGLEITDCVSLNDSKENTMERVLGIMWLPFEDVFIFSTTLRDDLLPYIAKAKTPTKRIVLQCVMSLFDPLGLLAPFTIHGKIMIQNLWRSGCEWDEQIDNDSYARWTNWISLLSLIKGIKIPRCYLQDNSATAYNTLQIHVFVDASDQAYGCAAFFRIDTIDGPRCSLVMAKTKVAPLKQLSIPRLELQAAVLGARLLNTVIENHDLIVRKRFLWTDSRNVLSWIRSDQRKYKPFVAFRIGEILQETKINEWRWVPSKSNIADFLTKWRNELWLNPLGTWFSGPQLLMLPESEWPEHNLPPPNTNEDLRVCHMSHGLVLSEPLIDAARISRWKVLLRTVCCVLRFISNCRRKMNGLLIETIDTSNKLINCITQSLNTVSVPFKQEEYEVAEYALFRMVQQQSYPDEVTVLMKNQQLPIEEQLMIDKRSSLYRFAPFLDEHNVLRMDGRTRASLYVPFDTRFPIILPRNNVVTDRLLEYYHDQYGHANKETVVNELRQRFYIPTIRACVTKMMKMCQLCRVRKCQPLNPRMAPLPIERLTPFVKPFSYVGIDYFGPIEVIVGRRVEKRWIVLFTCLTIRAVHLEVAFKLDKDSCIMAIRRFVLRRGPPITIFSDNGTNLKAASKELLEQIRKIDTKCANVFTNARTRWSFNPPSAPHMGGIWERMVRSVKTTMAALKTGKRLNDEILLTIIAEAEEIVNSRPLVYISQDASNDEALTPNHFVRGSSSGLQDPCIAPTHPAEALRSSYKRSQYVADELWKRWLKEYLPSLNLRTKWLEDTKPLKIGDLVFIADNHNRNGWIRGKVDEIISGKDGRTRQAIVRTSNGIYRRPVSKLALIEIGCVGNPGQNPIRDKVYGREKC